MASFSNSKDVVEFDNKIYDNKEIVIIKNFKISKIWNNTGDPKNSFNLKEIWGSNMDFYPSTQKEIIDTIDESSSDKEYDFEYDNKFIKNILFFLYSSDKD